MTTDKIFKKSISINASTSKVWVTLTNLELMKLWMSESEINIITDWKVGHPFIISGNLHKVNFENKGTVLQFENEKILSYSHLSSISRLPDKTENYSVFEFRLEPTQSQTKLTLTLSIFPTETIFKHLEFYWTVTLGVLKQFIENSITTSSPSTTDQ